MKLALLDDYSWSNVVFTQVKEIIIVHLDITPNIVFCVVCKDFVSYLSYSDCHCCCDINCSAGIDCGYRLLDKVKTK